MNSKHLFHIAPPKLSLLRRGLWPTLLCCALQVAAQTTPATLQSGWSQAARATDPGFTPSAARGQSFYERQFRASLEMPSCTTCHTSNPRQAGRHAITAKTIAALSPMANAQRFTDQSKAEKWFKRNCNDVAGRECTAAEKADLLEFLTRGNP